MVAPIELQPHLPADLAITERSRAFYDGTYKWDSVGFTDDKGVYREYDCYDPFARAPTPLPPMFPDDDEDHGPEEGITKNSAQALKFDSPVRPTEIAAPEPGTPCPELESDAADALSTQIPKENSHVTMKPITGLRQCTSVRGEEKFTELQSEVFAGHQYEGNLDSKAGVSDAMSKQEDIGASNDEGHSSGGVIGSKKEVKMPVTPPDSPAKTAIKVHTTSPASTTSTLSPVPSNLSDQDKDMGIKIKGASTTPRSTPSLPDTPSKSSPRIMTKSTVTRGVAQKVRKGRKSSKFGQPERKNDSVADFTLLELHSGSFMRRGGRRTSVRQTKSVGN
ncbi:hypothetical protein EJ07DRAFT_171054 [Lizonia empirigonia]|nr:hypothetical protein EJ07DRAFT_171054 [Lizonia empirigonia]